MADEIRKSVALCVALGTPTPRPNFEWPALDFGWSLAEVLSCEDLKDVKGESEGNKTIEEKTGEDNKGAFQLLTCLEILLNVIVYFR